MNDTGLNNNELSLITGVLSRFSGVERAVIFGSRAMGNYRPNSDVDLALHGVIDETECSRIAADLDELPLPYTFDVKLFDAVKNHALKHHINLVQKEIYRRESTI